MATLTKMSDSSIYAIGGEAETGKLKTVEKLTENGWKKYFQLPVSVSRHCTVAFDEKTILIVGGTIKNVPFSTQTFWLSPNAESLKLAEGTRTIETTFLSLQTE